MKVFVSHSLQDPFKASISQVLRAVGAIPYFAEHEYSTSETVSQKIEREIRECDIFLALLTFQGLQSNFVQQEIGVAHTLKKRRIVLVERGLEGAVGGFLYGADFVTLDRYNPMECLGKLQNLIENELKGKKEREAASNRLLFWAILAVIAVFASRD